MKANPKRPPPKSAWKKGQPSPNPKGRPKDGESWAAIIKAVGDMYPSDIVAFVGKDNDLGRMLSKLPDGVQMKYLVTARVFSALMFEPTQGLWKETMERAEGKVISPVDVTTNGKDITDTNEVYESILRKLGLSATIAENSDAKPTESE